MRDRSNEGLDVKNMSEGSVAVYRSKRNPDEFVFADALPKPFWKEFDLLIGT